MAMHNTFSNSNLSNSQIIIGDGNMVNARNVNNRKEINDLSDIIKVIMENMYALEIGRASCRERVSHQV